MNVKNPGQPGQRQKTEWGSIAQIVFSGLGFLGFISLAVLLGVLGISDQINQGNISGQVTSSLTLAWSYLLVSGLLVLSVGAGFMCIFRGKEPAQVNRTLNSVDKGLSWIILAWPVVLFAGYLVANSQTLNWILLPPIHLLAVGIPIIWLVHIGRRGLPAGSLQRKLATLSLGMVGSFLLAFIAEIIVLILIGIVGIMLIASNPNAVLDLNRLAQRISSSQMDPEVIARALRPYLSNPRVIFIGLATISGFVPLIEELFKPLAVWVLGRRLQTPAEGFAVGLLAGSGFALVESLGQVGSLNGVDWMVVEIGRGGTDLLHITTTGIMGWALVSAWRGGKTWLPGVAYLVAISIHGLWNALILGIGLAPYLNFSPASLPYYQELGSFAPVGLGLMVIVLMAILLSANRNLRAKAVERTQNADHLSID